MELDRGLAACQSHRMKWSPVSIIVLWLAVVVGAIMLMVIAGIIIQERDMTADKSKLITDVINSMVTIISVYVGAMIQKKAGGD